jgi:hypothetical protein
VDHTLSCWCKECLRLEGQNFQHPCDMRIVTTSFRTLSDNGNIDSLANSYVPRSRRCTGRRKAQRLESVNEGMNFSILWYFFCHCHEWTCPIQAPHIPCTKFHVTFLSFARLSKESV